MPIHLYRNTSGAYVFDDEGIPHQTRVLLVRARSKQSFGACVTSSPLYAWISCPRQVFGFAPEDGRHDIHVGGFDHGPFPWDDYAGDFYKLSALDKDFMNKIRSVLSELDLELAIECLTKLQGLLQNINWHANSFFTLPAPEECLTVHDKAHLHLRKVSDLLTTYFLRIHMAIFA